MLPELQTILQLGIHVLYSEKLLATQASLHY